MDRPRVLVSNDDGIHAEGLLRLVDRLEREFEVWVCAPDREQSARSHALTLARPLRLHNPAPRWFSVDGTPADAVYVAVNRLMERRVDLAFSGINHGANLGADVTYSGTVAAALEAALMGIPAVAMSVCDSAPFRFDFAADFAVRFAHRILEHPDPAARFFNVNIPNRDRSRIRGVRHTCLGIRTYGYGVEQRKDPRGNAYFWLGGGGLGCGDLEGSDCNAIRDGFVSVTPLKTDWTDHAALKRLAWVSGLAAT